MNCVLGSAPVAVGLLMLAATAAVAQTTTISSSVTYDGSIHSYSQSSGLLVVDGDTSPVLTLTNGATTNGIQDMVLGSLTGQFGGIAVYNSSLSGNSLTLGAAVGSSGSFVVSGSAATVTVNGFFSNAAIGSSGTGALSILAGARFNDSLGQMVLGATSSGYGVVTISGAGSTLTASGLIAVGTAGTGYLSILNSGALYSQGVTVGSSLSGNGAVTVSGVGSTWRAQGDISLGTSTSAFAAAGGNGSLSVINGGSVYANNLYIADTTSSNSIATVDGVGSLLSVSGFIRVAADSFNSGGNGQFLVTNGSQVNVGSLIVGYNTGSVGAVTISGAGTTLSASGGILMGDSPFGGAVSTATLAILNGSQIVTNGLSQLGWALGSNAVVTISGAGSAWTSNATLTLGIYATGSTAMLVSDGGALTVSSVISLSHSGVLTLNGGSIAAGSIDANTFGGDFEFNSGTVTISGGTYRPSSLTIEGDASTNSSSLIFLGATMSERGSLAIGNNFVGSFGLFDSATVSLSGSGGIGLGSAVGSSGTLTMSGFGTAMSASGGIVVGDRGFGYALIEAGAILVSNGGWIAADGGEGHMLITGAMTTWTDSGDLYIGGSTWAAGGTASLTIDGATVSVSGTVKTWDQGVLTVDSGGSLYTKNLDVSRGTLNFNDGTITVNAGKLSESGDLTFGIGSPDGSSLLVLSNAASTSGIVDVSIGSLQPASLLVSGSTWSTSGDMYVGGNAMAAGNTGVVTLSSGSLNVGGLLKLWDQGTIAFDNASSITVHDLDATLGTFTFTGGTLTVSGGAYTQSLSSLTIAGAGSPKLILAANATLAGVATLSVGGTTTGTFHDLTTFVVGAVGAPAVMNIQSSGTATFDTSLTIASGGTVTIGTGGSLAATTLDISQGVLQFNDGKVSVNAGTFVSAGDFSMSGNTASADPYMLLWLGATTSGIVNTEIGVNNPASLEVYSNGTTWSSSAGVYIGGSTTAAGSIGSLNVHNGSVLNVGTTLKLWNTGTLTLSGGSSITTTNFDLSHGTFNFQSGTLTINGGILTASSSVMAIDGLNSPLLVLANGARTAGATGLAIGVNSTGSLLIVGTESLSVPLLVGSASGSHGTVTISGSASLLSTNGSIYLGGNSSGAGGAGTLYVNSSASLNIAGTIKIWSGGTLSVATDASITVTNLDRSQGTFTFNDGIVTVSGGTFTNSTTSRPLTISGSNSNGSPTLVLANGATVSGVQNVYLGVTNNVGGSISVLSGSTLTNSGMTEISTLGTGSVLISGANSKWVQTGSFYVGGTNSQQEKSGTVTVNSSGSLSIVGTLKLWSSGTLTIDTKGSVTVQSLDMSVGTLAFNDGALTISGGSLTTGSTSNLTISGNTSSSLPVMILDHVTGPSLSTLFVGANFSGSLQVLNGTTLHPAGVEIGEAGVGAGVVTISGQGSLLASTNYVDIGNFNGTGSGTLTVQNGGSLTAGSYVRLSTGTLTLDTGGSITTKNFTKNNSASTFNFNDGVMTINSGEFVQPSGVLTINGNTPTASPSLVLQGTTTTIGIQGVAIGSGAHGNLSLLGGSTLTNSGNAEVGSLSGSVGAVTVSGSGSIWANSGTLTVGDHGTGSLDVLAGGAVTSQQAFIGNATGSSGNVTISGTSSTWTVSQALYIGHGATLNVLSGGHVSSPNAYFGHVANSVGTTTITGAGSLWNVTGTMHLGEVGTGGLNILSDAVVRTANATIGEDAGAMGVATVSGTGSTWTVTNSLYLGGSASGAGGSASLNIANGGKVSVGGIAEIYGGSSLTVDSQSTFTAASLLAPGELTNNGNLYTNVAIPSGGTLAGTGTIHGTVTFQDGSTLAPGNSPGLTTVNGDATWSGTVTPMHYAMQIADAAGVAGVGYDSMAVHAEGTYLGKLNIVGGSTIDVDVDSYPSNTAAAHFSSTTPFDFVLVTADGGITGFNSASFVVNSSAFELANPLAGGAFSVNESVDSDSLILHFSPAAVPEPGTLLLFALASGSLAWRARYRRVRMA